MKTSRIAVLALAALVLLFLRGNFLSVQASPSNPPYQPEPQSKI